MGIMGLDGDQMCTNCLQQPPPYTGTVCAFNYLVPISGLVNQFKHQHNLAAGRLLTSCLSRALYTKITQGHITMPQIVIPVPLHKRRLRQRGFNQAQVIAMGISQSLSLKINTQLCHRAVYHSPQQGQSRQQRIAQMEEVFNIARAEVDQKINSIAIVDDVMTTGATVQALSKTLITAWGGPLDIQIWCVARAQPHGVLGDW
tara:strand:+ start:88 stop:693 length:606 start_codon:yes stop_codon:yes gene_type:complete